MKSAQEEQAERRAYAGSTTGMTYHSRALSHIELEGQGRHAAEAKASVTGATRVPQVPRMPEGSPWAGDPVPPEKSSLGWSVKSQEPTGNYHEIEQSLSDAASSALCLVGADGVAAATEVDAIPPQAPAAPPESDDLGGAPTLRRGRRL